MAFFELFQTFGIFTTHYEYALYCLKHDSFSHFIWHERKTWPALNCVSPVLMQNLDIWNLHRSPHLVFLKTGILNNFCHNIFTNILLSWMFWHSFGMTFCVLCHITYFTGKGTAECWSKKKGSCIFIEMVWDNCVCLKVK